MVVSIGHDLKVICHHNPQNPQHRPRVVCILIPSFILIHNNFPHMVLYTKSCLRTAPTWPESGPLLAVFYS